MPPHRETHSLLFRLYGYAKLFIQPILKLGTNQYKLALGDFLLIPPERLAPLTVYPFGLKVPSIGGCLCLVVFLLSSSVVFFCAFRFRSCLLSLLFRHGMKEFWLFGKGMSGISGIGISTGASETSLLVLDLRL